MLSTTYKKAADLAAKSSKVALSLLLVVTAFLGFNSLTGNEGSVLPTVQQESSVAAPSIAPKATDSASPTPSFSVSSDGKKSDQMASGVYIKGARLAFPGLDSEGNPIGFTVAGENGFGKMLVSNNRPVATEQGTTLATQAVTTKGGPNVIIDQTITVDGNGTKYEIGYVALGINKQWAVATADATSVDFERTSNGQYLMTVTISLTSPPTSELANPVGDRGYDVAGAPKTITSRLLLNASKTQILAQAIYVNGSVVKAKG